MLLDCSHGFALEIQFRAQAFSEEMTVVSLGNGPDGSNVDITIGPADGLAVTVTERGSVSRAASGRLKQKTGAWLTATVSIDGAGFVRFQINGNELSAIGSDDRVTVPGTGVRLHNQVGRSNVTGGPSDTGRRPFEGEIGVLRLWNRALSGAEIDRFHTQPVALPHGGLRQRAYHRSVVDYRDGRPYLMSGVSDGSVPAVAHFELAVDKGLAIYSRSSEAYGELLLAQRAARLAEDRRAAELAQAHRDADRRLADAVAANAEAHTTAQRQLEASVAESARQRATLDDSLESANRDRARRLADANASATDRRQRAEGQVAGIRSDAYGQANEIRRDSHAKLAAAQAERSKYG